MRGPRHPSLPEASDVHQQDVHSAETGPLPGDQHGNAQDWRQCNASSRHLSADELHAAGGGPWLPVGRPATGKRQREDEEGTEGGEGGAGQDTNGVGVDGAGGGAGGGGAPNASWQQPQQPGELPVFPLVLPGADGAAAAAAVQAAVAEANAAASDSAAVASWLAGASAQQLQDASAAAAALAAGDEAGKQQAAAADVAAAMAAAAGLPEGLIAAVDAATAAALAGGADADTAAAMSASIAALMSDPVAAAAAAAAMSDPNNPASMHALAQLAQLQSLGQLGQGASADMLSSSFSALVAAAMGMAALEGGNGGLPPGLMGLPDPAVLTGLNIGDGQGMTDMDMQLALLPDGSDAPQPRPRGRPRKSAGVGGTGDGSGGNWMRRFHELAYQADKSSMDNAKTAGATMTLHVQWSNMPEELQNKLTSAPAPVDVPSNATVSFLKRAIGRTLGGHLEPSVLRHHATRELISDVPEDRVLAALGLTHNSYITMETEYKPIANFGLVSASTQRAIQAVSAPSGDGGSRVGTKERFTLAEMYALVEGMETHGLKWAKIHKDHKELEGKTQGDLKDKFRNWQRNVANGWSTARVYMTDELKQRIEKLVHEYTNVPLGNGGGPSHHGGRLLQAPSDAADASAALAASMAQSFGLGLDPSQLAGLDATMAAQLLAAHQQMQQLDPAMIAALAAGMDPVTGQQLVDLAGAMAAAGAAEQQQQQQDGAGAGSA